MPGFTDVANCAHINDAPEKEAGFSLTRSTVGLLVTCALCVPFKGRKHCQPVRDVLHLRIYVRLICAHTISESAFDDNLSAA